MENINIITSFVAGALMFLAPCTLPLVPGFIAYISSNEKEKAVRKSLLFCLGFLVTFLLFGILAGLLGHILLPYKIFLQRLGALFIIFFGLYILGVFHLSLFNGSRFFTAFQKTLKTKFSTFIFGVYFAIFPFEKMKQRRESCCIFTGFTGKISHHAPLTIVTKT